ncbi:MAG: STAS domain-containing protein [Cyanobacteria bacterium P01_C01_bin.38]
MQAILDNPQITIIRPNGCLDAKNAIKLERELGAVLNQSSNTIVLIDLEKVDAIDSVGLMALVSGVREALLLKQRLCFCSVAPTHRIIFELAGLDKVFEIFDTGHFNS